MMPLDQLAATLQADLIIRSTLLVGAVWLGAFALRRAAAPAATRHVAWLCGMVGVLLLPVLSGLLPDLPLAVLGADMAPAGAAAPGSSWGAARSQASAWAVALSLIYVAVAAALVARLVHARWKLARLWSAAEAGDPPWHELLTAHSARMEVRRIVGLRMSQHVAVPITWGTIAPKVLLPAEARHWPAERRELVLLHELAHVARKDTLGQCAASLASALHWFNPAIWLAAREMRLAQEQAADDLVLKAGVRPLTYATCLLEVARDVGHRSPAVHAAATAGPSQLERRLVAIVGSHKRGGRVQHSATLGAGVLVFTWLVATAVPVPAAKAPVPVPVQTAQAAQPEETERSYTATGSTPPEAAGPGERPARMPVVRHESGRGAGGRAGAPAASTAGPSPRVPRPAQDEAEDQPRAAVTPAPYARPPLFATGPVPPSRAGGLFGGPAGQPLSPTGSPRPPRPGEGPLPPHSSSPP